MKNIILDNKNLKIIFFFIIYCSSFQICTAQYTLEKEDWCNGSTGKLNIFIDPAELDVETTIEFPLDVEWNNMITDENLYAWCIYIKFKNKK